MRTSGAARIMRGLLCVFCFYVLLLSVLGVYILFQRVNIGAQSESRRVYFVYMGRITYSDEARRKAGDLISFLKRNKIEVIDSLDGDSFGFTACLSEEEANSIARRPGVMFAIPNRVPVEEVFPMVLNLRFAKAFSRQTDPTTECRDSGTRRGGAKTGWRSWFLPHRGHNHTLLEKDGA